MRYHLYIWAMLTCFIVPLGAAIADPGALCYGIRKNEVVLFPEIQELILNDMRAGLDPCPAWVERGGFTGRTSYSGDKIAPSIMPGNRPVVCYEDRCPCGDGNSYEGIRAGGLFVEASTDQCLAGNGGALIGLAWPDRGMLEIDDLNINCAAGLTAAIGGLFSGGASPFAGGGGGDLFSASGEVTRDGCAQGEASICGLGSIGGSVCLRDDGVEAEGQVAGAGSPPLTRQTAIPMKALLVEEVAIFDYARTVENEVSTIWCPEGCVLEFMAGTPDYVVRTIPRDSYVTMNDQGEIFGPDWQLEDASGEPVVLQRMQFAAANGAEANPLSFVSMRPQEGAIMVSEDLLVGRTTDEDQGVAMFAETLLSAGPASQNETGVTGIDRTEVAGNITLDDQTDMIGAFPPPEEEGLLRPPPEPVVVANDPQVPQP